MKGRRGLKRKAPPRKDDSEKYTNMGNEEDSSGSVRRKTRVVNKHIETSTIHINHRYCVCFIHYQDDVAEANG